MRKPKVQRPNRTAQPGSLQPVCSAAARESLMAAEADLMKAATEFAYQWGRDQTTHPKSYWLELHLDTWAKLARCALKYSECVEPPNAPGEPRRATEQ